MVYVSGFDSNSVRGSNHFVSRQSTKTSKSSSFGLLENGYDYRLSREMIIGLSFRSERTPKTSHRRSDCSKKSRSGEDVLRFTPGRSSMMQRALPYYLSTCSVLSLYVMSVMKCQISRESEVLKE